MSETALDDLATEQADLEDTANAYGDQVVRDMPRHRELLKGHAGDAHQRLMAKLRDHAYAVADHFGTKVATAKGYKAVIYGLKVNLTKIADAAEKEWNAADSPAARELVIIKYAPEVESAIADAWTDFHATPAPSSPPKLLLDTPTETASPENEKKNPVQTVDYRTDKPPVPDATDGEALSGEPKVDSAIPDATDGEALSGEPKVDSPITGSPGNGAGLSQVPMMPGGGSTPSMPSSPSAPSVPSSPLSSASSLMKPLSGAGSPLSSSMPSAPSAPTSPQGLGAAGGSPLVNATRSFQSGLSSGLGGSSGAVPPPTLGRSVEPLVGQPVAAQPGSAQPAGVPSIASGPGGPSAASVAAPAGGGGGGGGLAPFVPPGGGHAAPPPPGPTAAATSSPTAAGSSGGGQAGGQQSGAGGGPAVVAATSGGTAAGMLPERDPNPDLAVAKRVLTGLILGTAEAPDPVVVDWAVSVLNTSMGKQVVIASSMGNGGYVPATVALPADARLAVADRALPMGWAALFTGWPSPVDVLVAHSEKVAERLAGVSISAIAATNSGQASAYRPPGVADYLTVSLADVLKDGGAVPVFGGGYQHRMASVDPDLAQRLSMVDRGGDASTQLASQITVAVVRAAQEESLHTGTTLVAAADVDLLRALGGGAVIDWADHYQGVCRRENNAMFYPSIKAAPRDLDESLTSINTRAVYHHYYRMGRLVELVRCWQHSPPSVLHIAYCATTAGFGATVAAVTAAWEQHLNGGGA